MTTFGWKRKAGEKVSKTISTAFGENAKDDDDDEAIASGEVDWLHLVPKRRAVQLEDGISKAKRLRDEGGTLAEEERYWEALQKWDEAIVYNPGDEAVYEMKAQAYMQVGEVLPAIQAAKKSVSLKPRWWVSHQTLGRAFLGVGEVRNALRSFCKAVHLHPVSEELWEEDLRWTHALCRQSDAAREEKQRAEQEKRAAKIVELDEEGFCKTVATVSGAKGGAPASRGAAGGSSLELSPAPGTGHIAHSGRGRGRKKPPRKGTTLPSNYVCLREPAYCGDHMD